MSLTYEPSSEQVGNGESHGKQTRREGRTLFGGGRRERYPGPWGVSAARAGRAVDLLRYVVSTGVPRS
jgi:hypothetical protein